MCNMSAKNNILSVIFIIIIIYGNIDAAPPEQQQQHNTRTFRNALNQQGIQSILQSIENRLSNLDQIYSHGCSQRDLNTNQSVRKIEMLESKLSRLESSLDAQLEKLSENLSSKHFRDDITKDQIFRKIDSVYERFNHKLSYIEEKFDMAILKLQNRIDIGVTKIERLDDSINVRQADMESEISEGVQQIKTVKMNVNTLEEKIINVTRCSLQTVQEKYDTIINLQHENITKSLTNIDNKLVNVSLQCKDVFLNDFSKKEPSYNYSNKINNMYNELWKKSNIIESNIKNSVQLMNLTRKEIQNNFSDIKKISENSNNNNNNQNDGTLDIMLDSFTNFLQRKFSDLGIKMEDNFKNIIMTQHLFLDSCHRIQMDETQLETKISLVLEKLLDSLSNRSLVTFKELESTEEIIKSQSNNMERLINQNTNTIMKLSEKTSEDRKKIEKILSTVKKDFANFMTTIEHEINLESLERTDKLDNIGNLMLELQAQVNDLDRKMNKDNMNYNARQTLQDAVLQHTKDIFAKQLNISVLHNTITKVDDFVQDIHELLYNINTKINNLHKLNANHTHFDDNKQEIISKSPINVDIVFEASDKNTTDLFKYNYSIIDDNNNNLKNIPEASTVPNDAIIINNKHNIPVAPTVSAKENKYDVHVTEASTVSIKENINIDDEVWTISFETSSKEQNESTNYLNKNKTINIIKDENITIEKNFDSDVVIKNTLETKTNNFISIDKDDTEKLITEKSTNENNIPEIFTANPIMNTPQFVSDTTIKIESKEYQGVDIFGEIYEKFFGSSITVPQNEDSSEYSNNNNNKPESSGHHFDSFATTTDLVDNTDYDDHFYE